VVLSAEGGMSDGKAAAGCAGATFLYLLIGAVVVKYFLGAPHGMPSDELARGLMVIVWPVPTLVKLIGMLVELV
jgi:hypothetical protein